MQLEVWGVLVLWIAGREIILLEANVVGKSQSETILSFDVFIKDLINGNIRGGSKLILGLLLSFRSLKKLGILHLNCQRIIAGQEYFQFLICDILRHQVHNVGFQVCCVLQFIDWSIVGDKLVAEHDFLTSDFSIVHIPVEDMLDLINLNERIWSLRIA